MPTKQNYYSVLNGKYIVHQTLGTGGFAKVKLATHVLTGEKVAIKIMDKETLGEDLPRVHLEIEALKLFVHPNICRLYQVIETETKFFLVMEYCPGGELFDYIIERDRVTEKEAKHFFRQIIAAVSFIHRKGFAHRDLKPENLLLGNDQKLKLIDFGLCAKPKSGMQEQLETCCGSPSYAAPELITGENYNGSKVDVWSMGVLLYALLCGFLPFDDENVNRLYKKIKRGRYFCPSWLSDESKDVLAAMLQVDPSRRISIEELKDHPWITNDFQYTDGYFYHEEEYGYNSDCLAELAMHYKRSSKCIEANLRLKKFDYLTASYYLLLLKKKTSSKFCQIPHEFILRESNICNRNLSPLFDTSPVSKRVSMDSLTNSELLELGSPKKTIQSPLCKVIGASPATNFSKHVVHDKENFALPSIPSARKNKKSSSKLNVADDYVLQSPKFLGFSASLDTAVNQVGEDNQCVSSLLVSDKRAKSYESPILATITPQRRPPRPLGSSAKKVFGSIEKGIDCVRSLFTPKKRGLGAIVPRQVKNLCNVSAINDKVTPEEVLESLQQALQGKGILCKQKGYTLRGKIGDGKRARLRFELEVCLLPKHQQVVGVRRKRLEGDAWLYKRICEEVLRLALLGSSCLSQISQSSNSASSGLETCI